MLVQSGHQNFLSPPETSRFEPLDPADPRLAHSIEVQFAPGHSEVTQLSAVRLIQNLADGTPRLERCADVASFQNQDTCDVLPWYMQDGEYYLGLYEALRPVEAARELFGAKSHFQGMLPQLPGGYLLPGTGDAWIERAAQQVCAEKVGANPISTPRLLGGGYFTSIGAHTEAAVLVEVEVAAPPARQQMRIGQDFHQSIVSQFLKPQEIVDRFFNGEIPDVRLLEATYRFCERKGIELKLPVCVSRASAALRRSPSASGMAIMSAEQIRREADRPQTSWQVEQGTPQELSDFIRVHHLSWQAKDSKGDILTVNYADAITRGGGEYFLDTFDIGCYFWSGEKLYMTVQRGPREAIGFRNSLAHSIKTDCSLFHNDGISGSILSSDDSASAIDAAIAATIRDKTGCEPLSSPQAVGFYYPSSGFSTEGTYGSLVEIDPHKNYKCSNEVFAVELNDLLELMDQGYIRDVRLSALAHTLGIASNYPKRQVKRHDPEVVDLFNSILSSGVELQHFLQSKVPQIYSQLVEIPEYRRLIAFAINEFGGVVREYSDPEERYFFRAAVPIFTYYDSPRDIQEWSLRVVHDTAHFIMGELSPYLHNSDGTLMRDSAGVALMRDKSEFIEWYARSECKAVAISDAVLASNQVAAFSWRARSAEVFAILGINNTDAAFELIEAIELNGHIPAWVLQHPRYLECRDVIVGRLLQFSALDHAQLQIFHQDMVDFPEVAETLAQFGRLSTSPQEYAERVRNSFERIVSYGEGVNPINAYVNGKSYNELLVAAIEAACIERFAINAQHQDQEMITTCRELRAQILKVFHQSRKLTEQMNTIEPNDARLNQFEHWLNIKRPVLARVDQLHARALAALPESSAALLRERQYPCYRSQKGVDFEAAQQRAYQMERASYGAAGIEPPIDLAAVEMWT